jgi:hypothetical protein
MREHAGKVGAQTLGGRASDEASPTPGKQSLVQLAEAGAGGGAPGVHAAAAAGISGPAGSLPHLEQIQGSFGRHDVRHVQAHLDDRAAAGAQAMGAQAFATGDHVAFAGAPSLHTAAHEAAHVVQQRAGVQLKSGVGEAGDAYERHADAAADLVVQGKSAEHVLDAGAGPAVGTAAATSTVQRKNKIVDDPADPQNTTAPGTGAGLLQDTAGAVRSQQEVKFGPLVNGCGSSMHVFLYPGDDVSGSSPSVRPNWWNNMVADPATDPQWVTANIVQGHLLNEKLGGPGSDMRNLTPFAKSTNSQHHAYVEKKAKAIFARGNIVRYSITVNYSSPPPAAWFNNKISPTYLPNFPYSIECILDEYSPTTGTSLNGQEDVTMITNAVTGQG